MRGQRTSQICESLIFLLSQHNGSEEYLPWVARVGSSFKVEKIK